MRNLLFDFFNPSIKSYTYDSSKKDIVEKLEAVLQKQTSFLSEQDIKGAFTNDSSFSFSLTSPAMTWGVQYSSTLYAVIISDNSKTIIQTKTKPGFGVVVLFFVTFLFGCIYLYKAYDESSSSFLAWGLAMGVLGPAISLGIYNVSNGTLYNRYNKFIHKKLEKSHAPNSSFAKVGQTN
jgi:hypothetical protein